MPVFVAASTLACGAALATVFPAALAANLGVFGVSPLDQARYVPIADKDGKERFRCFSGADDKRLLPYSAVNDDYCDCADGSDEPGTSACAGRGVVHFYCANAGSQPAYIYQSRVNDGVCDCCDGSDEKAGPRRPGCPDTCNEAGRVLRAERARREAVLRSGIVLREQLLTRAVHDRADKAQELQKLQSQLPELELALTNAIAVSEADALRKATATIPEQKKSEEDPAISGGSVPSHLAQEHMEPPPVVAEGHVVSEYTKWMEGSDKVAEVVGHEPTDEAVADEAEEADDSPPLGGDDVPDDEDEDEEVLSRETLDGENEDEPRAQVEEEGSTKQEIFPRIKAGLKKIARKLFRTESESVAMAAVKKAAETKLREAKNQIEDLERLDVTLGEDHLAYYNLHGRCLSKKLGLYSYQICFFKDAKQGSTLVGSWRGWEAPNVALFDKGDECPGGPARSLRMIFQCGSTEEIVSVEEPSRCTYEAIVSHAGACTDQMLEELVDFGPLMPNEEL